MNIHERIDLMVKLGEWFVSGDEKLAAYIHRTSIHNPWFTIENQNIALHSIAGQFLQKDGLEKWVAPYMDQLPRKKIVGIIMAGNIPLVGFHDFLSCFIMGHVSKIKLSDKDPYLWPFILETLGNWHPEFKTYYVLVNRMEEFDAIIATGSNNTSRYFEAYFGKYPNIIRKNRTSVALLSGNETEDDFRNLGKDIFQYFGLGCRNVSYLYVPRNYNFNPLLEILHEWNRYANHSKYKNNFDYNYALFILNKIPYHANGSIMMVESKEWVSRIATLHFGYYESLDEIEHAMESQKESLQCLVTKSTISNANCIPFGNAQIPQLEDYPDGVDLLSFLSML